MFPKFGALAVLSLCFLVRQSVQEECAAQGVTDLRISSDHILQWKVQPDEPCDIDEFQVHIFHPDQPAEYSLSVKETYANVSFLHICEEWIFAVVPISGYTMGAQRRLVTKVPLPPDAHLGIEYINLQHNSDTEYSYLQWGLSVHKYENCSITYKVTIEEEGSPPAVDFYPIVPHFDLIHLKSCKTYDFKINAINNATPSIEGPVKTSTITLPAKRQRSPFVLAADAGIFNISLSFRLESEIRNPCPLRSLMIEGDSSNTSLNITLSAVDWENPVNVTITGLLPTTLYNMNVYVSNTGGWSDPTMISITTKDIEPDPDAGEEE